jgi:hypothetical protein
VPAKTPKTPEWAARERLRDKGQFWTPSWVAQPMVTYSAQGAEGIFDPGVGRGAFAKATAQVAHLEGRSLAFAGSEVDPEILTSVRQEEPNTPWLSKVRREDFLTRKSVPVQFGIVANPPYIRHHRLDAARKAELRALLQHDAPGLALDGRAGLHVYFLVHALALLRPGARLSFIVPADLAEGVFASALWTWVSTHFALEAVWRFDPAATPFAGVDTNPLVLCIRRAPPQPTYTLATVHAPEEAVLRDWVTAGFPAVESPVLSATRVDLAPALVDGISRDPAPSTAQGDLPLSVFAKTERGIATGDNEFFFLTAAQIRAKGLPQDAFTRAIGRTSDAQGGVLTLADLDRLESKGRPTWLLNLDRPDPLTLPGALQGYLAVGEHKGLPQRPLIAQRKPWYRMERRKAPYWLFAYLGRRDVRFIRNEAGIVPLTGFLCVSPRLDTPAFLTALSQALADPRTLANLARVGKTYGAGAIKVEPRGLERLAIPAAVIEATGLRAWLADLDALTQAQQQARQAAKALKGKPATPALK